jgi:hypothetical protein
MNVMVSASNAASRVPTSILNAYEGMALAAQDTRERSAVGRPMDHWESGSSLDLEVPIARDEDVKGVDARREKLSLPGR